MAKNTKKVFGFNVLLKAVGMLTETKSKTKPLTDRQEEKVAKENLTMRMNRAWVGARGVADAKLAKPTKAEKKAEAKLGKEERLSKKEKKLYGEAVLREWSVNGSKKEKRVVERFGDSILREMVACDRVCTEKSVETSIHGIIAKLVKEGYGNKEVVMGHAEEEYREETAATSEETPIGKRPLEEVVQLVGEHLVAVGSEMTPEYIRWVAAKEGLIGDNQNPLAVGLVRNAISVCKNADDIYRQFGTLFSTKFTLRVSQLMNYIETYRTEDQDHDEYVRAACRHALMKCANHPGDDFTEHMFNVAAIASSSYSSYKRQQAQAEPAVAVEPEVAAEPEVTPTTRRTGGIRRSN